MPDRFVVTGAMGCIGAWIVRLLLDEGTEVTTFDPSTRDHRLRALVDEASRQRITHVPGDVTDLDQVVDAFAGASHVIHLAALQVPLVRANPSLGASVNVVGTINVFEAALRQDIDHLVYASSIAVFGPPSAYPEPVLGPDDPRLPETLYGVFKVANEDAANIYWEEQGLASIGLRPHTVFGPGRDQGVTSAPTVAIQHAVGESDFRIPYGGAAGFMYARDVAQTFIDAARAKGDGASAYSMGGDIVPVSRFVDVIESVTGFGGISHDDTVLPFPEGADDTALAARLGSLPHTPLHDAIAETADFFRAAG